jgi:catechol 2,3-dioxygenase-like lactoylglutathione lyase family enzyme
MRKSLIVTIGLAAALAALPGTAQTSRTAMPSTNPAELPKVFAVQLRVADLDRSERFYREVFGAKVTRVHDRERAVQLTSGVNIILVQAPARAADAPAPHGAGGFLMQVVDLQAILARVDAAGGSVERAPQAGQSAGSPPASGAAKPQRNAAQAMIAAGLRAAMVRDPDGVLIEVIQFPSGR